MGVIDIITRVDVISKKYEKYDIDKHKDFNLAGAGDDTFLRLYAAVEADFEQTFQKSETAAAEKKRATAVAIDAEIRPKKARLLQELPKLQRLAFKKVKRLSREELEAQSNLVTALKERIEAVPDGLQEYEMRKMKQELDRQVPLMDEIDDKADRANSELKNTNVQLKDTITKLRSSSNFCIDVILLCAILGIATYLYIILK